MTETKKLSSFEVGKFEFLLKLLIPMTVQILIDLN